MQLIITAKLLALGNDFNTVLFVFGGVMVFHFCTLEEYYTGGLFLPVGNPVSDGSIAYIATICTVVALGGPSIL
jgi:hypothetical protein